MITSTALNKSFATYIQRTGATSPTPQNSLEQLPGETFSFEPGDTKGYVLKSAIRDYRDATELGIFGFDRVIDAIESSPNLADIKEQAFTTLQRMNLLPVGVGVAFGELDGGKKTEFLNVPLHQGAEGSPFGAPVGQPVAQLYLDNTTGTAYVHAASNSDSIGPAAPHGLALTEEDGKTKLSWTTTGDDAWSGKAQKFDVRISEAPLSESGEAGTTVFHEATQVSVDRAAEVGVIQEVTIPSDQLQASQTYHVGVRIQDEAHNLSPLRTLTFTT